MSQLNLAEQAKSVTFQLGNRDITLETGRLARQATAAVYASEGRTRILATVVAHKEADPSRGFFPLGVFYQERTYAGGRIPGGFFRREGRPTDRETLTSRLIDRPLRPLFPAGFQNEVQVVITVMAADPDLNPDTLGMLAAMAAVRLTGIPTSGPVAAVRVGMKGSETVINPTYEQMEGAQLDMVVAATREGVVMVESDAEELPEETMLGAVFKASDAMQVALDSMDKLAELAGVEEWVLPETEQVDSQLEGTVKAHHLLSFTEAFKQADKSKRSTLLKAARAAALSDERVLDHGSAEEIGKVVSQIEHDIVRDAILAGEERIDGRTTTQVRPIECTVGELPTVHGSATFTRGETQAIVAATLGSDRDAQLIETVQGVGNDSFMLHYNFPPYSVGETGMMGGPKRREIGHGRLARRAVERTLPSLDDFPYTIRVVSEITESNGSSSMASVCGASLALMDAGVPVSAPVAGVAMGLVASGDDYRVLTDILGDEDHLGDMDFKVAGSSKGITALQMDLKITSITRDMMEQALKQAKVAREEILDRMNTALAAPREEISEYAPCYEIVEIPKNKIGAVIGPGGSRIREIQEASEAKVSVDDDAKVRIFAPNSAAAKLAADMIEESCRVIEVGAIYTGEVKTIRDFGAFVAIAPGQDGMVHLSEITHGRVNKVEDHLAVGDRVQVKVLDIDQRGRVKLSMKAAGEGSSQNTEEHTEHDSDAPSLTIGEIYEGTVVNLLMYGAVVEFEEGLDGMVHISEIIEGHVKDIADHLSVGDVVKVKVITRDERGRYRLSIKQVEEES